MSAFSDYDKTGRRDGNAHTVLELRQRRNSFFLKIINSFRVHYLRLRINLIITELICLVMTARGVEAG